MKPISEIAYQSRVALKLELNGKSFDLSLNLLIKYLNWCVIKLSRQLYLLTTMFVNKQFSQYIHGWYDMRANLVSSVYLCLLLGLLLSKYQETICWFHFPLMNYTVFNKWNRPVFIKKMIQMNFHLLGLYYLIHAEQL